MSGIISYVGSFFSGNPVSHDVIGREPSAERETLNPNADGYNRVISGQIVVEYDKLANSKAKINVFVKDFFGVKHYVGSSKVDDDGNFHLLYHWNEGPFSRSHELILAVVDKYRLFAQQGLHCVKDEIVRDCLHVKLPAEPLQHNLGLRGVDYGNDSPDLLKFKKPIQDPVHVPESHPWKSFTAHFPETIKRGIVGAFSCTLSSEKVQGIYESFGPEYPKVPLTPENLIDELLNQIGAGKYQREGRYVCWTAYWPEIEFDNDQSVPNVKVIAQFDGENKLTLKGIGIWFRNEPNQTNVDLEDPNLNPEQLRWAIYVARSTFSLKAEENDLAAGHILPNIVAHAFFKYVEDENPIYATVAPHLEQCDPIEWKKLKDTMFGKESLMDISALSENSVAAVLIRSLIRNADFMAYEPENPLCEQHHAAKAEAKYFWVMRSFFSHFLRTHWQDLSKVENWSMIYKWSESMHKNFTVLPKITEKREGPEEEDLLRLAQFLAWIVTKTTFLNLAAFSRRKLLAGSATLALENKGLDSQGRLASCGNAHPSKVNKQNYLVRTSLNFEEKAQDKDFNQQMMSMLRFYLRKYPEYPYILKAMTN